MLGSATDDLPPHNNRVRLTLEEAERFGLKLVIPWLQARLEYVKNQAAGGHYIHPLLDELQPLLHDRRRRADAKREFVRLLDELEAGASGMYRVAVAETVSWLGIDSSELTHRIKQWARAGEDKLELALAFLPSTSWPVFTERARVFLDARPDDPQVKEALLRARDPFSSISFMGDLKLSYRARADDYRRWVRSRDKRLREIGQAAVALYERLADEQAKREQREQEGP